MSRNRPTGRNTLGLRGHLRRLGPATWSGIVLLGGFLSLAIAGGLRSVDNNRMNADPWVAPSLAHPFGTDNLGRDLFVRVCDGAWASLTTSVATVALALLFAIPIGIYAASAQGRWPDHVVMRIVESTQVVPQFILAVLILGLGGTGDLEIWGVTVSITTRLIICLALGFLPFFARVIRSTAVGELQEDYVENLRLIGVPRREILLREVFPNVVPTIAVQALLAFAIAVFAEGGLSFLGMGVAPPEPTLGNLINDAAGQLLDGAWWYALIPGTVLVAGIVGANLVGDSLTSHLLDAYDAPSTTTDDLDASADDSAPHPTDLLGQGT